MRKVDSVVLAMRWASVCRCGRLCWFGWGSHRWDAVIVFGRGTGRDQMDDLHHHDDPQGW